MRGINPTQVPTVPVEMGGNLPASTVYLPGISLVDLGGIFPPLEARSLATIAASSYGPCLTSNSTGIVDETGAKVITGNYIGNIGQEVTIFWAGDQNAVAASGGSEIFGIEFDDNGDAPYHTFALALDGSDNVQAICGIGSNYYDFTASSSWTSSPRQTWVATIQIGGSINLYNNGILLGSTSGLPTGTFATTPTSTLRLGNYYPNGYSNANNAIAGFYNGIWSPGQVVQFNAEPFSMLRPIIRRKYYFSQTTTIINISSLGEILGESGQSSSGFMFGNSVGENSSYPLTNLLGELALTSVGGQFAQEVSEGGQISQIYIQQTELGSAIASNLAYSNQKTLSETNSQGLANQFVNSQIYTQQEELGSVVASNLTYSSQNVLSTTDSQGHAVTSLYAPVLLVSSEDQSVSQGIASLYVNSYVYVQQIALGYESASNSTYSNQSVLSEENAQGQAVVSPYVPVLLISSEDQSVSQGLAIPHVNSYVSSIYDTAGFSGQSVALSASIEAFGETTGDIAAQAYVSSHVINIGSEGLTVSYGGFDNIKRYTNAEYLLLPFKNFNKISIG